MPRRRNHGFKHLNKEFGLFDTNHKYNLSEKGLATKPYSFELWAVSYIVDRATDKYNFQDIAFMMMISDLKYFEVHFLEERTGWAVEVCQEIIDRLTKQGYFKREKPKANNAIYYNRVVNLTYKYYPTHKYRTFLKKIENDLKELHEQTEIVKRKGISPPNKSKRTNLRFSIEPDSPE